MIKTIEVGKLSFSSSNTKEIAFTKQFSTIPKVSAMSIEENVNIFIKSITLTGFIVEKSSSDNSSFFWTAIEV